MSDDLAKLMEADFEEKQATSVEKIDQQGLTSVAGLARLIRDKELKLESLETSLKAVKKELQKLTDEEMPAMLAEIGISSFALDDGSTVEVKTIKQAPSRGLQKLRGLCPNKKLRFTRKRYALL